MSDDRPSEIPSRPERPAEPEQVLWEGRPSQWINFGWFMLGSLALAAPLVVAVFADQPLVGLGSLLFAFILLAKWLQVRCTHFVVTSERIKIRRGVLSRQRHELELYRVKDTTLDEPLLLRLVSLANLRVTSSDRTTPELLIPAIADAEHVKEQLRRHVERLRDRKRVREIDFE